MEGKDHGELKKHRIVDLERLWRTFIYDGDKNDYDGDDVIRNNCIDDLYIFLNDLEQKRTRHGIKLHFHVLKQIADLIQ